MKRLVILCEGHSEEAFAKRLLVPHLAQFDVFASAVLVETSERHRRPDIKFKGGVTTYEHVKGDLRRFLVGDRDPDFRLTTFLDFFHLPADFPGMATLRLNMNSSDKIALLEKALSDDINDIRFIPYIQKHEFEALVFVDLSILDRLYPKNVSKIDRIRRKALGKMPEDVNGGDQTSPSMRILEEFPQHERNKPRVVAGLETIGLDRLRAACPRFHAWISRLEELNFMRGGCVQGL